MPNPQKECEFNVLDCRVNLIRLRTQAHLAVKHFEPVQTEDLPDDAEFWQTFWVLLSQIDGEADVIDVMFSRFRLPGFDDRHEIA